MIKLIIIGTGGFIGSILRYLVSGWAQELFKNSFYPVGTFVVNIIGCIVIGFLAGMIQNRMALSANTRLFIIIGLLGSFTTFSTFSNETFSMLTEGQYLASALNVILSVAVGLIGVWAGYQVSNLI